MTKIKPESVNVLSKLPNDVIRKILLDMDLKDVFNACSADIKLATNVCNETFWRLYGLTKLKITTKTFKKLEIKTWDEMVRGVRLNYIYSYLNNTDGAYEHYDSIILPFGKFIDIVFVGDRLVIDNDGKLYTYMVAPSYGKPTTGNTRLNFRKILLNDGRTDYVSGVLREYDLFMIDSSNQVHGYEYIEIKRMYHQIPIVYNGKKFSEKIVKIMTNRVFTSKGEVWILYDDINHERYVAVKEYSPKFNNFFYVEKYSHSKSYGIDNKGKVWMKSPGRTILIGYVKLAIPTKVISIFPSHNYTYFLDENGDLWAMGEWFVRKQYNPPSVHTINYNRSYQDYEQDYYERKESEESEESEEEYEVHKDINTTIKILSPTKQRTKLKFKRLLDGYAISTDGDIYYLTPHKEISPVNLSMDIHHPKQGYELKIINKKLVGTTQNGRVYYLKKTDEVMIKSYSSY